MAAPDLILKHGTGDLITRLKFVRRSDGFDEGDIEAHTASEFTYQPGQAVPGYGSMIIASCGSEEDGDGEFMHELRAIGLRSGSSRLISSTAVDVEDGFDVGTESWIVLTSATSGYVRGRRHSKHSQLYCTEISVKSSAVDYYSIVDLSFKGIKTGGRPNRLRFSTASREITKENTTITSAGGDGATAHTWNILRGDPVLQVSYISQARPNFTLLGTQGSSHPDFPSWATFNWTTNDEAVWQWPNGVVLADLQSEEIMGTTVNLITATYVHRDRVSI